MNMLLTDSIGFQISNTGRKLSQLLSLQFQPFGLTSEQWSVLHSLCEEEGVTQRMLSIRTEKDPTNVTRILDQLERKGLVRREPNREDRRSFLLTATEQGRKLAAELEPIERQLVEALLEGIEPEQLEAFRAVMAQVNRNAERIRQSQIE
jgi:DNA-binding MarR family transcriptional regulator